MVRLIKEDRSSKSYLDTLNALLDKCDSKSK